MCTNWADRAALCMSRGVLCEHCAREHCHDTRESLFCLWRWVLGCEVCVLKYFPDVLTKVTLANGSNEFFIFYKHECSV